MPALERFWVARLLSNLQPGALRRLHIGSALSPYKYFFSLEEGLGTFAICREVWRFSGLTSLHLSSPCHILGHTATASGTLDLGPLRQLRELHLEHLLTGESAARLRFGALPELSRLEFKNVEARVEEGPAAFPALQVLRLSGDHVPIFCGPHTVVPLGKRQMLAHVTRLELHGAEASRVLRILEDGTLSALQRADITTLPVGTTWGYDDSFYQTLYLLIQKPNFNLHLSEDVASWFERKCSIRGLAGLSRAAATLRSTGNS